MEKQNRESNNSPDVSRKSDRAAIYARNIDIYRLVLLLYSCNRLVHFYTDAVATDTFKGIL